MELLPNEIIVKIFLFATTSIDIRTNAYTVNAIIRSCTQWYEIMLHIYDPTLIALSFMKNSKHIINGILSLFKWHKLRAGVIFDSDLTYRLIKIGNLKLLSKYHKYVCMHTHMHVCDARISADTQSHISAIFANATTDAQSHIYAQSHICTKCTYIFPINNIFTAFESCKIAILDFVLTNTSEADKRILIQITNFNYLSLKKIKVLLKHNISGNYHFDLLIIQGDLLSAKKFIAIISTQTHTDIVIRSLLLVAFKYYNHYVAKYLLKYKNAYIDDEFVDSITICSHDYILYRTIKYMHFANIDFDYFLQNIIIQSNRYAIPTVIRFVYNKHIFNNISEYLQKSNIGDALVNVILHLGARLYKHICNAPIITFIRNRLVFGCITYNNVNLFALLVKNIELTEQMKDYAVKRNNKQILEIISKL